jgi:phosphatidate cytidylyltransferase
VTNLNARVRAWWVMIVVGGAALWLGWYAVVGMFAALAWLAWRELTPPSWLSVAVPIQFALVALDWRAAALLFVPIAALLAPGRDTRIGMLLCIYGLSFVPMLRHPEWMLYVVLIVQASDVLQYLWGRAIGRHAVAPKISPAKTVEGLVGGVSTAVALGAWLSPLTPFPPGQAAAVSLAIALAGFASGLVFSAIKRQRGIKDWGTAIAGHGGVLDRVDSLCLAAPLFYAAVQLFHR